MASSIHKVSQRMIDYAERMSDVADAAQGKRKRGGIVTSRWFLLPAAGAGLWALVRSDSFSRQAREVVDDAKSRATELPDDLIRRVRKTTASASTNGAQRNRRRTTSRSRSTARKPRARTTSSTR